MHEATCIFTASMALLFISGAFSLAPNANTHIPSNPSALNVATLTEVSDMIPVDTILDPKSDFAMMDVASPLPVPSDLDQLPNVPKPRKGPTLDTWKRRLNTKEDKFNIHKWSGGAFAVSSTLILATGLINGISNDIPSFLEAFDIIFNVSIIIQCISSIEMADKHRRNQPEVRDQFKALAYGMILSAIAEWINGPFALDILIDNRWFSDMLILGFGIPSVGYPLKGLWEKQELTESRLGKGKKRSSKTDSEFMDAITGLCVEGSFWINSLTSPLIYLVMLVVFLHPEHDHTWMMEWQDDHAGQAATYYGQIYGNTMTMWSGLITTVRDKKLIGKDLESVLMFFVLMQIPISIFLLVK